MLIEASTLAPTIVMEEVCDDSLLSRIDDEHGASRSSAWQSIIDATLVVWQQNPALVEDCGFDAADPSIIRLALVLARDSRDRGLPAPDRIIPDPNGGIVFERKEGEITEMLHVWDDGAVEYMQFDGARLVERRSLRDKGPQ